MQYLDAISKTTELASLHFTAICNASSDNHLAFLNFFLLGMILIPASCTMSRTSVHSSSGTLTDLIFFKSICHLHFYNHKECDLGHT